MRKHLLLLAIVVFIISCKKNNSNPYYFEVQIGKQTLSFDSAGVQFDTLHQQLSIYAINYKTYDQIIFGLTSSVPHVLTGKYIDDPTAPQFVEPFNFGYLITSGNVTYLYSYFVPPGRSFSVTINQCSDSYIQGTFSGSAVCQGCTTGVGADTVISGKFAIKNFILL